MRILGWALLRRRTTATAIDHLQVVRVRLEHVGCEAQALGLHRPVATTNNTKTVELAWDQAYDNVGVTAYVVFRNGIEVGRSASTSLTLSNQPASTDLFFQVLAVDAAGNRSVKSAPVTAYVDITKPTAPQGVTTYQSRDDVGSYWTDVRVPGRATARYLTIIFDPSSDDRGVTAYAVYRNNIQVTVVPPLLDIHGSTSFALPDETVGTTNWYQVQAIDAAGNRSAKSAPAKGCVCDVTPPYAPKNIVIEKNGNGASVTWDYALPEEHTAQEEIRYGLLVDGVKQLLINPDDCGFLCGNQWFSYQPWNAPPPVGPGYAAQPLPRGRPLSYQVFAVDGSGNVSAKSAPVYITL